MRSDNPIKGNYQVVRKTGQDYINVYDAIRDSIPNLNKISSTDQFRSVAISAIRARVNNLRRALDVVKERYREAGEALIAYANEQYRAQLDADEALKKKESKENEKKRANDKLSGARSQRSNASNEITFSINPKLSALDIKLRLNDNDTDRREKQRLESRRNALYSTIRSLDATVGNYESDIRSMDSAIAAANRAVEDAKIKRDRAADRAANAISATNNKNDGLNDGTFDWVGDLGKAVGDAWNAVVTWTSELVEAIKNGDWDVILDKLADIAKVIADVTSVLSTILTVVGVILAPFGVGAGLLAAGRILFFVSMGAEAAVLAINAVQAMRAGVPLGEVISGVLITGAVTIGTALIFKAVGKGIGKGISKILATKGGAAVKAAVRKVTKKVTQKIIPKVTQSVLGKKFTKKLTITVFKNTPIARTLLKNKSVKDFVIDKIKGEITGRIKGEIKSTITNGIFNHFNFSKESVNLSKQIYGTYDKVTKGFNGTKKYNLGERAGKALDGKLNKVSKGK